MTFQLDTTGTVHFAARYAKAHGLLTFYRWSDLSPFTQGYIEALFASSQPLNKVGQKLGAFMGAAGFSDLAPETLARIIADCERERARPDGPPDAMGAGKAFWIGRNTATRGNEYHATGFPPLTVQLGDDGKVRFA